MNWGTAMGNYEDMPKTVAGLNVRDAVSYLRSKNMQISEGTLYNRMSQGEGPRREKRNGRLYFSKADLDAWHKHETTIEEAYS